MGFWGLTTAWKYSFSCLSCSWRRWTSSFLRVCSSSLKDLMDSSLGACGGESSTVSAVAYVRIFVSSWHLLVVWELSHELVTPRRPYEDM